MIQRNLCHAHYYNLFRPCTNDRNMVMVPRLSRTNFITRLFQSMIKDLPWRIFVSKNNQPPVSSAVCVQRKWLRPCMTTEAVGCDSGQRTKSLQLKAVFVLPHIFAQRQIYFQLSTYTYVCSYSTCIHMQLISVFLCAQLQIFTFK